MPIQQVSFQNTSITKQKQQHNVAVNPVMTSFTGDTVEISKKKKEDKALKYTLIGVGLLLGIVAIVKRKNIAKLFEKAPEVKPDVKRTPKETPKTNNTTLPNSTSSSNNSNIQTPSPKSETNSTPSTKTSKSKEASYIVNAEKSTLSSLVPLEQIITPNGKPFIEDCSEGYQLWHFVSPEFLEKFISSHQDLSGLFDKTGLSKYRLYDLKFIKEETQKGKAEVISFVKAVKDKTGVDLCGEFKHYRFIGQSELNVIRAGKDIEQGKYITLSAKGGGKYNVPPNFDYRVTFKNTNNIVNNLAPYHDTEYKTWTGSPYTCEDIEKVEKLVDGKWQEVEFLPKNDSAV